MSLVQLLLWSPCLTDSLFLARLETWDTRFGAMSAGDLPLIQRSSQNKDPLTSPNSVNVEALKNAITSSSVFRGSSLQALLASVFWSHN